MLLPVDRSVWAVLSGYCGLLVITAPFAILFGVLAIREIKESQASPQPKYGMGRSIFGIVTGSLALIAFGVNFMR